MGMGLGGLEKIRKLTSFLIVSLALTPCVLLLLFYVYVFVDPFRYC